MKFADKVYSVVAKIPKGKVLTYKQVGEKIGSKAYRAIGQVLKKNPNAPKVPCHRVVCSDGRVGGYCGRSNSLKKEKMLKKEGVKIKNHMILGNNS